MVIPEGSQSLGNMASLKMDAETMLTVVLDGELKAIRKQL